MYKNVLGLKKILLSAMFLAIGAVLPLFTGQIKEIGDSLLPMHFPVMMCGFLCGGGYGALIGLILPPFRSMLFSMPPLYPNSVWMSAELMTYGFVSGFLYSRFQKKNTFAVTVSLISAQLLGRIVWGIAKSVLLGVSGKVFTISAFFMGGFLDALPGIILQLVFIPSILAIMKAYKDRS